MCTEVGPSVGVVFKLRAGQLWDRGFDPCRREEIRDFSQSPI